MSDLLSTLDAAIDALVRLRAELAAAVSAERGEAADDLVDTWTAAARFDLPIDTVRWLAREKGFGEKRGGRWLVSTRLLREHVERGG